MTKAARIANQTLRVLVPSRDPIHPVVIAKGDPIPAEVLDLYEVNGWAADAVTDSTPPPERIPGATIVGLDAVEINARGVVTAITTSPNSADRSALAAAAAATLAPPVAEPSSAPIRARASRKIQIPGGATYAKGAIMEGDDAANAIAQGVAVAIKDGAAPETKG